MEVINILTTFRSLTFLNLSNNLLCQPFDDSKSIPSQTNFPMKKLVLNGNKVSWKSMVHLVNKMPELEELHISTNNLGDPGDTVIQHSNLRQLYLSCNPICDFTAVSTGLVSNCSRLELLSLAECPVSELSDLLSDGLTSLNISTTKVSSWTEVEKLRQFPGLRDLRIQGSPVLDEYTAHEKRMMLIARLPNIKILNGGDIITPTEREDAERSFIRHFLDTPPNERPERFDELVAVHGLLDPLVNVDLKPELLINVNIYHKDEAREEKICVRQTVKKFKLLLQSYYNIAPGNMRVWFYDQEITKIKGPEEMKWHTKELYTYNVRDGDYFVVDEKVQLKVLTGSPRAHSISFGSGSPNNRYTMSRSMSTGQSPHSPTTNTSTRVRRKSSGLPSIIPEEGNSNRVRRKSSGRSSPLPRSGTSPNITGKGVARNLFGNSNDKYGEYHHSKVFPDLNKK